MARIEDLDLHHLKDLKNPCEDCLNFKDFGEKCWYFWERKKQCSQKLK